jgi:hypothetical protein
VNLLNAASMSKKEEEGRRKALQVALAKRELERQALLLLAEEVVGDMTKLCGKAKHVEHMLRQFVAKETRADFDAAQALSQ